MISMCTALLVMHVNIAPYRLIVIFLCLAVKGPNMSTPQWVNGAASFDLQVGKLDLLFSYSSFKSAAVNIIGDHLLYSRIGTNYPVSSSWYFVQSDPATFMSIFAIAIVSNEIKYFSLSGQQYWMSGIITGIRILQSYINTNHIQFINKQIQLRYPALSVFLLLHLMLSVFFALFQSLISLQTTSSVQ